MFSLADSKASKLKKRYKKVDGTTVIDLNLKNADQLFDGRDPAPFREKDLDEDAVKYILTSLREIDESEPVRLRIFITQPRGQLDHSHNMQDAIRTFFTYEAEMKRSERDHVFRMAFKSLFIGLSVLSFCIYFSQLLEMQKGFLAKFLSEGLHILGWYSMWKPVYFGLYEWWPIREEEVVLLKAADMNVEVVYAEDLQNTDSSKKEESSEKKSTYKLVYK